MAKIQSYTRPGVQGATCLIKLTKTIQSNSKRIPVLKAWTNIESRYQEMLREKGGTKLCSLDDACEHLAQTWSSYKSSSSSSSYPSISKEELIQTIVEWKFTKGKARYALMKHLRSNDSKAVREISQRAFRSLCNQQTHQDPNATAAVEESMKILCLLKGVGPATASAILSLYRPDIFVFMDDEVIECLHPGKRDYTLSVYKEINEKCLDLAKILGGGEWTARRVGKVLWTAARICATLGPAELDRLGLKAQDEEKEEKKEKCDGADGDDDGRTKEDAAPTAIRKTKHETETNSKPATRSSKRLKR